MKLNSKLQIKIPFSLFAMHFQQLNDKNRHHTAVDSNLLVWSRKHNNVTITLQKRIFNSRKKIPLNVQLEIPDNRPIWLSFLLKFLPCEQIFSLCMAFNVYEVPCRVVGFFPPKQTLYSTG